MGDRANVRVLQEVWGQDRRENTSLHLYTHWAGTELPYTVARALDRGRERWNDSAYLARIIFNEMTSGHWSELTGYGISVTVGDGDDRIITVDCKDGVITNFSGERFTFEAFITRYTRSDQ